MTLVVKSPRADMETLGPFLDRLVSDLHRAEFIRDDPLSCPRRFAAPGDHEVVALLAALFAWGRVAQIASVMERLLSALGPHPADFLRDASLAELRRSTRGLVHRVLTSEDIAVALHGIGGALRRHADLQALFLEGDDPGEPSPLPALGRFCQALRPTSPRRSLKHLFPDPAQGSACKRWMLFLRWVVRPDDGVDLGLWSGVSPRRLIVPLDTHLHRIGWNLRLTGRRDASLRTAVEITEQLRRWRPDDPVACDFSLTRLGIHQLCPSRVDPAICAGCALQPVCRRSEPISH